MRRALVLAFAILLLRAPHALAGESPAKAAATLALDSFASVRLEKGQATWTTTLDVPGGAERLTVILGSAQRLALRASRAGGGDAKGSDGSGTPTAARSYEQRLVVSNPQPGPWSITVEHPAYARGGARFDLVALVDGAGRPIFVRERLATLPAPDPEGYVSFRFLVPPWARRVRVDADGPVEAGGPGKAAAMPAAAAAPSLVVERSPAAPAGVWIARTRPEGKHEGEVVLVEEAEPRASGALEPGEETEFALADDEDPKDGDPDRPAAEWTLEVAPGSPGFALECTAEPGGDVDLYVRRGEALPPSDEHEVADYVGLSTGEEERVVLGGTDGLPAATYHVKAVLAGARKRTQATIVARPFAKPSPLPAPLLRSGVWSAGATDAHESATRWFTVEAPAGATSLHAQVVDATGDVDLVAADPASGAIVARAFTPRFEESIVLPLAGAGAVPPRVLLGVVDRDVSDPRISFRIAVAADDAPALPPDLRFPPFHDAEKRTPIERAVDAVVDVGARDGMGTGICVAPIGYVLTCRHVLERDPEPGKPREIDERGILVGFTDDPSRAPRQQFVARLVDSDETLDLALLQITDDVYGRAAPRGSLPFLALPDTLSLHLGDPVLSIGFPGCGSEKCRTPVIVSQGVLAGLESGSDGLSLLKTDAMVEEGHSGGALVTPDGALVGLISATLGERRPLGLALPAIRVPVAWLRRVRLSGGR